MAFSTSFTSGTAAATAAGPASSSGVAAAAAAAAVGDVAGWGWCRGAGAPRSRSPGRSICLKQEQTLFNDLRRWDMWCHLENRVAST